MPRFNGTLVEDAGAPAQDTPRGPRFSGTLVEAPEQAAPGAGVADAIAGTTGGIIEGIPIAGPYIRAGVDRAAAYARSVTGGKTYDEELAGIQARARQFKADHPIADTGAQIAGGVLGTLPAVVAAPTAFGAGAGGLALRSGVSMLSGAGIGGADTAVRTGGDLSESVKGTLIGGGLGLVAPGAGQLVGRGVRAAGEAIAARRAPVPGLGNPAATMLAEDFRNAGGVPAVRDRLAELGPEAMLLDASPSFTGRAQGLAVLPDTREAVTAPLIAREATTNARVAQGVDRALGPAPVPSQVEAQFAGRRAAAGPMYEDALSQAGPVDTTAVLAEIGQRLNTAAGAERAALERARSLLTRQSDAGLMRRTDPRYLHNAKGALDELIEYGDPTIGVARGALSKPDSALSAIRGRLNAALEEQVPGYASANLSYRTAARASEALESGRRVLGGAENAIHPADFAADLARRPMEQQAALRAGVRSNLDRVIGGSANDLVALRRQVLAEGDWNRAKLVSTFGPDAVDDLARTIDSNTAFRASFDDIVGNSRTAQRTSAAEAVAPRKVTAQSGDGSLSLAGLIGGFKGAALAATGKGARLAGTAAGRASDIARNRQLADVLAQGATPEREAVLLAMADRLASGERARVPAARVEAMVRALLQSQGDRVRSALPAL